MSLLPAARRPHRDPMQHEPMLRARLRGHRSQRVLGWLAVVGLVATATVGVGVPAYAVDVHVPRTLFGMHDPTPQGYSYNRLKEGSVRLWDKGVEWRDIETSPGVYNWKRLDGIVSQARSHDARITMVVAMTPSFYSSDPTTIPPDKVVKYEAFVRRLMYRYRGRIESYQVWNEANISTFWSGGVRRMARLTQIMDRVRDRVAPGAIVVGPQLVTRMDYQRRWIGRYEKQFVDGVPVWRFYDVASFSLYPMATVDGRASVPEDTLLLLRKVKRKLQRAGVPESKPIWDTEINYGLQTGGGGSADPITDSAQAANVIRTYLLQAARGVTRISWYRYAWGINPGGGTMANTLLSDPNDASTLTPAGNAYALVRRWMHGTLRGTPGIKPCQHDPALTYTCVVTDGGITRHIYWNPFREATVQVPGNASYLQDEFGVVTMVPGGSTITVDFRPVMVSN